ncbi:MAG: putative secreted glycosyl hydrolase [Nocardioidaceae bacterium]|nr:putative secreted glycosyl hydrolase [Nocardioidaceae bacterium]
MWSLPARVTLGGLCLVLTACTAGESAEQSAADGAGTGPSRSEPSRDGPRDRDKPPTATSTPPPTTTAPDRPRNQAGAALTCARQQLSGMDRQARAGQLVMIGVPADSADVPEVAVEAIATRGIGGVILTGRTGVSLTEVRKLTRKLQGLAASTESAVRLEVSVDQEGGQVQALSGPGFSPIPTALDQGQLAPAELRRAARGWGRELARAGVTLDLAPVVDVVPPGTVNEPIGAYDRQFGSTPKVVAAAGAAFVRGMQAADVATSIKHFPGLGRASGNTDTSAGVVDTVTTESDPFLRPFVAGMRAGSAYVMLSTATYTRIDPDAIAAFSPAIVDTMLRDRLGYRGVAISDDLGMAQSVANVPVGRRAVRFVAAGGDMVLTVVPEQAAAMVRALQRRAEASAGFARRMDAAALRVLTRKARAGLAECR